MSLLHQHKEITKENFIRLCNDVLSNNYEMVKKINKATFGDIYLVLHKQTKVKRCLKVYTKDKMLKTKQNKFLEEFEILKVLDHPNIFQIYEFYEDEVNFYLITEFLEGGELFDFLGQENKLDENLAFIIIEQVISAVNYLHKHNIIHRDLKLENLVLVKRNDPSKIKLIDFGTSQFFQKGNLFHNPLGSCYYVAPEVIRREYDEKADIWSIGVILHILLCGYPPFTGSNENQIYVNILKQDLVLKEEDWLKVSEEAKDLIFRMLQKFPYNRISLKQCLEHPWILENDKKLFKNNENNHCLVSLKNLYIKSKFEKSMRLFSLHYLNLKDNISRLINQFKQIDTDHDGMISLSELKQIFVKNKISGDLEQIILLLDVNKDKMINYSEFLMATFNFKGSIDIKILKEIFDLIDQDKNERISLQELGIFLNLEDNDPYLYEIMNESDINKDFLISFEEFTTSLENIFDLNC